MALCDLLDGATKIRPYCTRSSTKLDATVISGFTWVILQDNSALSKKVQEMAGQMIELRSLLQAVKDENERLSTTWRSSAEVSVGGGSGFNLGERLESVCVCVGGVSGCNLGDRLESVLAEGQGLIWAKGSSHCGWGGGSGFNLGERLESVWVGDQGLIWARDSSQCVCVCGGVSGCNLGDRLESVLAEGQGLIWARG